MIRYIARISILSLERALVAMQRMKFKDYSILIRYIHILNSVSKTPVCKKDTGEPTKVWI